MVLTDIHGSVTPQNTADITLALVDTLRRDGRYAIAFGGQGATWIGGLSEVIRLGGADRHLRSLLVAVEEVLDPVASELLVAGPRFAPLSLIDLHEASAELPVDPAWPALSVPGIVASQLLALDMLRSHLPALNPVAVLGHSQGLIAAEALRGVPEVEVVAAARLIGAAIGITARRRGLTGRTMVSVSGVDPRLVEQTVAGTGVVTRIRNQRRAVVLSGTESQIATAVAALESRSARERADRTAKRTGGAAFAPTIDDVDTRVAFHHPGLAEAANLAASWAEVCALDARWIHHLTMRSMVDPVDWVEEITRARDAGADWIIDLGPADIVSRLSTSETRACGIGLIAPTSAEGMRSFTTVGASPVRPRAWEQYQPRLVTLPGGQQVTETAFTRLTGKSPILLAGMTPTTVDPAIVAAAANAGYWAELAGGGQVTEPVFADNIASLDDQLLDGRTWQFNALLLDPYLWKLQLGSQRLVQKARAAGAAIDGVVVSAGIPELPEAIRLIEELRGVGITHVAFKPGTIQQIRQTLAIADEVAPLNIIVQIEGGQAGGHHSWEDLDELLISTYAELRSRANVVVCVGGGIGTPDVAADYLTGRWAERHDQPRMPVDGVLIGTAAMAAAEATTSPQVKQLLVDTPGTTEWIGAGSARAGMSSGRSQLGADIHEIDNAAARTGRLLDEVAGDVKAVAERREEIIAALNCTAKPAFGDVATMTYEQFLRRFAELCGAPEWIDDTFVERFLALVQRTEGRFAEADRGRIPTAFARIDAVRDVEAVFDSLLATHPGIRTTLLHPAEESYFVQLCRQPGKPVPFVPVVDADVRRWWRSDSLWQAHDARYGADEVCIIPGPVAVGGIERVNEPIAELLARFELAATTALSAEGAVAVAVAGRQRADQPGLAPAAARLLAAPDVSWAGRLVTNPLARLADQVGTGAVSVVGGADAAEAVFFLGHRALRLNFTVPPTPGALPSLSVEDAAASVSVLAEADPRTSFGPDDIADHAAVTHAERTPAHPVPDAIMALAWADVFAALRRARADDGTPVVEGMLDLVHLDHAIELLGDLPSSTVLAETHAKIAGVVDTEYGRVVTVTVEVALDGEPTARLNERFAIRGRVGAAELADPPVAGGAALNYSDRPRRKRLDVELTAPVDLCAFATVTGDRNPIHTSEVAARLAGLGGPIVHGMWTSAAAQQQLALATGRRIAGWTARFMAPVRPGAIVAVRADRVGIVDGAEIIEVVVGADDEIVMRASCRLDAPRTAYAFPGQGIQAAGMGMTGYHRSSAARAIWDRADRHTREALGFSILTVVRDNPTELTAQGTTHRHLDGVLFLTQFTQVAMAVLGAAQMAELRETDAFCEGAFLAGHSVGEYNALAAVSGVLSLETVIDVVFERGQVMHTLVPRDEEGRSMYRLAAIRPAQIGLDDNSVTDYIDSIAAETGEFLQIVNYNLKGSQYAVAGTIAGLDALEQDIERRRAEFGGRAAYILVPGIDVPFHSRVLAAGVPDFRATLDSLLPASIDPQILQGRYVPNLVPRAFSLDEDFITEIENYVGTTIARSDDDGVLCRTVLIELLAWQFASPVRWIETQDLLFGAIDEGGLGVERFVEVGVATAPTVANLASATLKQPGYRTVEVANLERDSDRVLGTDTDPVDIDDDDLVETEAAAPEAAAPAPTRRTDAATPADLAFTAADATTALISWWTKVRPDQLGAADSIETLCDGASSRRNQLLVDLGAELSLGAIEGAADAELPTLRSQVKGLARSYTPFGQVLSRAFGDHLKKVLGPTGRKQSAIADRVLGVWQLGPGWSHHVIVELAMSTRDGASVRGGSFGDFGTIASGADLDGAIDACVGAVARREAVTVSMPGESSSGSFTVDAEALAQVTGRIDDALVAGARTLLAKLGLTSGTDTPRDEDDDAEVLARVEAELGSDWLRATQPCFDARRAVDLDDRWASAREDVARVASGEDVEARFVGAGEVVARHARWWAAQSRDLDIADRLATIAAQAELDAPGLWASEVAVVTGASPGSIAASLVAELLAGGATVVATSSRLSADRVKFFTSLYRKHASRGAVLHLAPANLASFGDVDALAEWITDELKLVPTLLFPFAAGRVLGEASDAGPRAETEMRILLWSVERLIGNLGAHTRDRDLERRLHVVLPGSPNRGSFGGDGAYGEAKAALDALVAKWSSERSWSESVTMAHAIIGWVRGTGLMGGNDPLVAAVEAAGVCTWSTEDMATALLDHAVVRARGAARTEPVRVDLTGGLADADLDLGALASTLPAPSPAADAVSESALILALAPSPAELEQPQPELDWGQVTTELGDMVVIVGAGELGPCGSSRTRFEYEVSDRLSAAGVLELAWTCGLVAWDTTAGGWYDVASGEEVGEAEIADRYEEEVRARTGVRSYGDDGDMTDHGAPLLESVFLREDLTFPVAGQAEAEAMRVADPEHTRIAAGADGEWTVTRLAGTEIRVPRRLELDRTVGGQIPTGFDPTRWGIPAEMAEAVDRVALWNVVCTVDAFTSSGFSPSELLSWVHPSMVANTQGTGMGGMTSMRSLYIDTLLGEPKPNDILQEALPNVIAAHVVQSYVGGYGAMVHPVAACATAAVSVEDGMDKIRLGKADLVVAGGFDDLSIEGIVGFGAMSATANSAAMAAKGIEPRYFSRANDARYGGFVESQGGGTVLLARASLAAEHGLPVLGVLGYAASFGDGVHSSIPAPGLGALSAGRAGPNSALATALAGLGVTPDDIAVLSKHDTSTGVNERNESELHERLADALGRDADNPLLVISQKSLTGHAKGGAAAFQLIGLCQVLSGGVIPPNRSLDNVLGELDVHERLVWLREPLRTGPLRAGLVTSLGFGHVSGVLAVVHPQAFLEALPADQRASYLKSARARRIEGRMRLIRSMCGGAPMYVRPAADRRLGEKAASRKLEVDMLVDPHARLGSEGVYSL